MRRALLACLCLGVAVAACTPLVRLPTTAPAPTRVPAQTAPTPVPAVLPAPAAPLAATPTPAAGGVAGPPVLTPDARAAGRPDTAEAPLLDGVLDGLLPEGTPTYGLVLEDLGSGARTAINEGQEFPSASLYKLGVAWLALREVDAGSLSLDDALTIEDDDTVEPEPAGGYKSGDSPTIREALQAMMTVSSNAAAHAFLRVLGRDNLNQEMARIGLTSTRVPDDSEAVTSASDVARLLRLISTSPELSVSAKEVLAEGMANVAPPDALRDTLPDGVGILDKTGNLSDSSNVGALLETDRGTAIVVVVDTNVNPGDARAVIAEVGQIAYRTLLQ